MSPSSTAHLGEQQQTTTSAVDSAITPATPAAPATPAMDAGNGSSRCISILDIFGFEKLETNSLEQLLINHTNERLQLFFLHQTLHSELSLYQSEGSARARPPTTSASR